MNYIKLLGAQMTEKFLQSLKGLSVTKAKKLIKAAELKPMVIPEECTAVTSIARSKTVIVWQKDGKVRSAEAGDPCEIK